MFQHLLTEQNQNPKGKAIYIMQNGEPNNIFKITFKKPLTKQDIIENAQKQWHPQRFKNIRVFGIDAVEFFDEDLLYLKNGDRVFVSKGEDFDSNKNFGEYQIIKLLGEGGFGSVSLGRNKITGQYAAIKVVKANKATSSSCIDMIFRQAQNLKSLSHPNIVKIMNCYALKNMKFVVVMEYLEGGELKQLLKQKIKFQEEQARVYFKQIVSAVSYCHRQGIVHRDLKLQNILLSKQNQIKVADFGISGVADRFNAELDWGTLKYMPPQILSKKQKANAFSGDVWACGIILFYMVQGYLPFSDNSSSEIINKIINKSIEFSPQSDISQNCQDLILKMLEKDPKKRIIMCEIQNSPWYLRGSEGSFRILSEKKIGLGQALKQCNKPRKLLKKSSIVIPKRLQKQKIQVMQQLQGYRMTRKMFKSESKVFPELRSTQNKIKRHTPNPSKLSSCDLEPYKKQYFKAT